MVPIEQKDWTEEDRASKLAQHHPLDSTKRLENNEVNWTDEPANGMKYPTMRRKRFLVFLFKLKNGFNIAPRRGR